MYYPRQKIPDYSIPKDLELTLLNDVKPYKDMTSGSEQFMRVLQKLQHLDHLVLAECHYLQFLKLGLYLEEFEDRLELNKYELRSAKIIRTSQKSNEFKIYVKNLDSDNPNSIFFDSVEVQDCDGIIRNTFTLRVTNTFDNHVTVTADDSFSRTYDANKIYNVKFYLHNYKFRCCHYALSLINHKILSCIFPNDKPKLIAESQKYPDHWFNESIMNNPEQKQAVINIISQSSYPEPYILYGPPGTGKTATLTEAVCQILHNSSDNVLICTPSNAASDVIAKRLLNYVSDKDLYRIYSQARSKVSSKVDDDIKQCSNYEEGRSKFLQNEVISSKRIVITTLCTCAKLLLMKLSIKYSYIFIDEAGQPTQPECLIPFVIMNYHGSAKCQIIISGDPKQLGPRIRSKFAKPILGQSILERLMECKLYKKDPIKGYNPCYISKLVRNYRSHPAIIRVSNELFYDNELITSSDTNFPLNVRSRVIFHATAGKEEKLSNSASSYNIEEATKVLEYISLLLNQKLGSKILSEEDIGIVTPFSKQCSLLIDMLQAKKLNNVTVGTVEIFQGQEKEVVIISTVRTRTFVHDDRQHIGFLSNPQRFNVALTRARALLIVIGDPKVLRLDPHWRYFLNFCQLNNALRGVQFELKNCCDQDSGFTERIEESTNLFSRMFKILEIDDGVRQIRKPLVSEFLHYPENGIVKQTKGRSKDEGYNYYKRKSLTWSITECSINNCNLNFTDKKNFNLNLEGSKKIYDCEYIDISRNITVTELKPQNQEKTCIIL